ncbi:M15 family metallopeptidase [Aquibacillus rhizosphaerae]|uniref:M15 family metallopeptidase n=1 Tax=Aquibacillus rhizosphaerae TaxID=3051431 RepID=A0ABT7L7I7_9BACI|nr:M15 family metallopeptidase [Aquibacillus sp. LR5S19]MDL4841175.1 M15 family metallopeptidase [Aquibacillus sp. LR5S19]
MKVNSKKVIGIVLLLFGLFILLDDFVRWQSLLPQPIEDAPMPTELHPIVNEKKNTLITKAANKNISIVITDGFRTIEEQNAIYARGRTTDGTIVTNAEGGESFHNYGLAIDFALQLGNGDVIWDLAYDGNENGEADWMEVVEIAKDLGFEWGGDWARFQDYPHLQMNFGLSIRELQRGKRPETSEEEE